MPTIRHYCEGHEYRYTEEGEFGEVFNNYGVKVASLTFCPLAGEYYELVSEGELLCTVHINEPDVATFKERAKLAIGQYVAHTS